MDSHLDFIGGIATFMRGVFEIDLNAFRCVKDEDAQDVYSTVRVSVPTIQIHRHTQSIRFMTFVRVGYGQRLWLKPAQLRLHLFECPRRLPGVAWGYSACCHPIGKPGDGDRRYSDGHGQCQSPVRESRNPRSQEEEQRHGTCRNRGKKIYHVARGYNGCSHVEKETGGKHNNRPGQQRPYAHILNDHTEQSAARSKHPQSENTPACDQKQERWCSERREVVFRESKCGRADTEIAFEKVEAIERR